MIVDASIENKEGLLMPAGLSLMYILCIFDVYFMHLW